MNPGRQLSWSQVEAQAWSQITTIWGQAEQLIWTRVGSRAEGRLWAEVETRVWPRVAAPGLGQRRQ